MADAREAATRGATQPAEAGITVVGTFRSGTNFLRSVLELNYHCTVRYNTLGWKHWVLPLYTPDGVQTYPTTRLAFITKNPFSALASLHAYAGGRRNNLSSSARDGMSAFLSNPFVIHNGKGESLEMWFRTPVDYWTAINWNLSSAVASPLAARPVRYEDLVDAPEAVTDGLAGAWGLTRREAPFQVIENRARNLPNAGQLVDARAYARDEVFDRDRVATHRYMDDYAPADVALVMGTLDHDLVARLGYADLLTRLAGASGRRSAARTLAGRARALLRRPRPRSDRHGA
ncbi:hypothetical protein [Acuticoccus sp.]|uniref:hypothetical protein n=1 Tax=Acuticoccus sp. TaxID=1904378 RepID=UPI003B52C9D2